MRWTLMGSNFLLHASLSPWYVTAHGKEDEWGCSETSEG